MPHRNEVLLMCLLLTLAAAACSGSGQGEDVAIESESGWGEGASIDRYTLRGEIVGLPDAADPDRSVKVHHEAIPDFRSAEGEIVGMGSMTMPFPVADGLKLDGFADGDKIEMTLEVNRDLEARPPYRITRVTRLPEDAVLDFGEGVE